MDRTNEELADTLQGIKETIDKAYEVTQRKHGTEVANAAIYTFFKCDTLQYFTQDEDARKNMEELIYRPNEHYQVLADYAISSYILNGMECDISCEDLAKYANDRYEKLDYSGSTPVKILALASAQSNYWATNLLSINRKLKAELLNCFIQERYVLDRKEELDSVSRVKMVHFSDQERPIFMSKIRLNNDVRNMNSDEEFPEYIPPTRRETSVKK